MSIKDELIRKLQGGEEPAPPTMTPELARALGARGGAKGGGKWYRSLTPEQQAEHMRKMRAGRKRRVSRATSPETVEEKGPK